MRCIARYDNVISMARDKVAVSLDRALLQRAERLRQRTGESRSALLDRALKQLLRVEEHRTKVTRYVEAYREQPERAEDTEWIQTHARDSLASVAWEDED